MTLVPTVGMICLMRRTALWPQQTALSGGFVSNLEQRVLPVRADGVGSMTGLAAEPTQSKRAARSGGSCNQRRRRTLWMPADRRDSVTWSANRAEIRRGRHTPADAVTAGTADLTGKGGSPRQRDMDCRPRQRSQSWRHTPAGAVTGEGTKRYKCGRVAVAAPPSGADAA